MQLRHSDSVRRADPIESGLQDSRPDHGQLLAYFTCIVVRLLFVPDVSRGAPVLRRHKGQTLVEFALVVVLFFMFLFTIMDFAMMFFVNQTMQHAVRAGSRLAVVHPGSSCRAAIIANITAQSMGFYDKNANASKTPVISAQTLKVYSGTPINDATCGTPQQPITVSLVYSWPLLTPFLKPFFTNGQYTFTVKSTVVNEPKE